MPNELTSALLLMAVGMLTVFVILSIVVVSGQVLIRLMNRLHREEEAPIPARHLAVLTALTHALTQGRARAIKVEKDDAK